MRPRMRTNPLLLSVCAAALIVPFSASAQDGKKYQLKLDRPDKAGDKSQEVFSATLEKSQRITQGDTTLKEEVSDVKMELSGEQEVLEVSAQGKVKKLSFKVEKFTLKEEENPVQEPFKPGTVITGTGGEDGKEKFEADGKEIKGRAAEALSEVLSMNGARKKQIDEDAAFGTKEPRAVGSEWDVDAKAFLESMPDDMPLVLKPESVRGKAKFPAVKTINGVECCQFQMSVTMKPESIKGMPPGFKLETVNIKVGGEQMVPVDGALQVPAEKMDQQMEFSGSIPSPAGAVKIAVFNRTVKERTSKPVK
jgi:hypothetical protein